MPRARGLGRLAVRTLPGLRPHRRPPGPGRELLPPCDQPPSVGFVQAAARSANLRNAEEADRTSGQAAGLSAFLETKIGAVQLSDRATLVLSKEKFDTEVVRVPTGQTRGGPALELAVEFSFPLLLLPKRSPV